MKGAMFYSLQLLYLAYMIKAGIFLISSIAFLFMHVSAQTLRVEAFVSGGGNFSSVQSVKEGFWQDPFPTFYVQSNLGYCFSDRLGAGVGLTYFPVGIRRRFLPKEVEELDMPFYSATNSSSHYNFMPHFYVWYAFPESSSRLFSTSQLSLGLLYAKWSSDIGIQKMYETELTNGQTLYRKSETVVIPHTFLAVEFRWDVRLLRSTRHGLFGVLHIIKGINPIRTTIDTYSVESLNFEDFSRWVTRGDYIGIGITYKWKFWNLK